MWRRAARVQDEGFAPVSPARPSAALGPGLCVCVSRVMQGSSAPIRFLTDGGV